MELTTQRNYRLFLYVNTFIIVLLGTVIAGWGVFLLFPASLGQGYHSTLAAVQAIRKVLFWKVAIIYAIIFLFIVVSIVVLHLFYSHRIAGPAYRISLEAAKIAHGNLTGNITFRQKDNLTDIKDFLNDVVSQYRDRITSIKDYLTIIETESKIVSDLIGKGKDGIALRKAAEEITNNVKNIECSLSEMKT